MCGDIKIFVFVFWNKLIILFSKDALNSSSVTVKAFIMFFFWVLFWFLFKILFPQK